MIKNRLNNNLIKSLRKTGFLLFTLVVFLAYPLSIILENNSLSIKYLSNNNILAQESSSQNDILDPVEQRKMLEEELKKLEDQIAQNDEDINRTAEQKNTLKNQITIINKEINKLNLQIQQSNLIIKDLNIQIVDTQNSVEKTSFEIEDSKNKLANILRAIYEEDQKSLLEVLFTENELSDFFNHLVELDTLSSKNQELLKNITDLKTYLEEQKQSLDKEKVSLEKEVSVQTLQRKQTESTKKTQNNLLQLTETQYQQYLKEKEANEKKRDEIRAKMFELVGVSKAPTFGEALDIAKAVSLMVSIRPAFLLAVISQESAIGRNLGQCLLSDSATGTGTKISTGKTIERVMSPKRDVQPFLKITSELGRDPYNTAVSCPLSYGWGGAMGPAQFIPSTWNLYIDKLKNALGRAGDPWGIKDSFVASALYLSDLGASAKTTAKEKTAANRYYGSSASSYGTQVMQRAACIQSFIDSDEMSSTCENLIL